MVALPIDSFTATMYTRFFRLTQAPFSISPDPRYLFMSERHREALAHLLYGVDSGGLVLLTGEIGTGKTTVCRCFLEQVPANCNVAYIFNPKLTVIELLQSVCEEFHVGLQRTAGVKDYIDTLNRYLLEAHAGGRNNVLVIDEAQNLSADVLEQLRLLTNLETNERKLLQIMLIGQPELRAMLARPELEQLAQRVVAHYHLTPLSEQESASYIQHRLASAGLSAASPFQQPLMKQIHRLTQGVPRRINLLCDRALLGAYAKGVHEIDRAILGQASEELFISQSRRAPAPRPRRRYAVPALMAGAMAIGGATAWTMSDGALSRAVNQGWSMSAANKGLGKVPDMATAGSGTSAPTTAGQAILPGQDGLPRAGLRDEKGAIRQLAQMWGLPLQDGDPCEDVVKANLRCYRSHSGFGELKQLDRPAVLKLYDPANRAYYALMTGLTDSSVTLRAGDAAQTVNLVSMIRHFRGEFVTLWRAPPTFGSIVEMSDQGPEVDWIAMQLAKLNGEPAPAPDQPFDQRLLKQVRHFQRAQGLFVDGVLGPVTLMHLNRVAGVAEPDLRNSATAME